MRATIFVVGMATATGISCSGGAGGDEPDALTASSGATGGAGPDSTGGAAGTADGGSSGASPGTEPGAETETGGDGPDPVVEGQLPLEVLGIGGTVREVMIDLAGAHGRAAALYVQANNLSYDGKAEIRVNEGTWRSVADDTVDVLQPDASYGGIDGGFGTIRFTVPLDEPGLRAGDNRIEFRYSHSRPDGSLDPLSIGYRVVDLDVVDEQGERLLPPDAFERDDPQAWDVPSIDGTPATDDDAAAGQQLWSSATLRRDWHGEATIEAHCADCHLHDGRDLAYFNYSNRSIIERARFHGLSELEGQQIAAYIRRLPVQVPSEARPWNPPYQPGPGTASKPRWAWAAGAGLDAVLDDDADMATALFGGGSQAEIDAAADRGGMLDVRELPIAVQLPDWKHWLPRVHPVDIWGRQAFEQGLAYTRYQQAREALSTGDWSGNALVNEFDRFPEGVTRFLRPDAAYPDSGATWAQNGAPLSPRQQAAVTAGFSPEMTKLHLASWAAVKQFELVEEFELMEGTQGPAAEHWQYPTTRYTTFHLAAHYIGDDRGTSHFIGEDPVVGAYFSSIWYQVQLTINPGQKTPDAVEPVDWAYNYQHILRLGERSGVVEPYRYFQNLIKGYQARDLPGTAMWQWTMREVSPWRIYSNYAGDDTTQQALGADMRTRVTNAMLEQFLDKVETFAVGDWERRNSGPGWQQFQLWAVLETAAYQPRLDPMNNPPMPAGFEHQNLFAFDGASDAVEADAIARLMPRFAELGVDCTLRQRLGAWASSLWPAHDWSAGCA